MGCIELKEDIGIKTIREFYPYLMSELEKKEELVLDFAIVNRIDCAVAQVLMVANKYAKMNNKTIKLKKVGDGVMNQLRIIGFAK
jgi:anti-anti-sigma regulatory factor